MSWHDRAAARALQYGLAMETVGQLVAFRGLAIVTERPEGADRIEAGIERARALAAAALHDLLACGQAEDEETHD